MGKGQGKSLTLNSAFRVGFTGTLGVGLAFGLITALQSVATVIIYIGLALFLALGLEPIVLWLVERRLPRSLSVVLVVLAFLAIVAGAVLLIAPAVISQIQQFIGDLPDIVASLAATVLEVILKATFQAGDPIKHRGRMQDVGDRVGFVGLELD